MHIDELENVATHNAYPAPAVTPGRGILKTPGRVKTPAASTARTPKAWNNNPNAKHRVTSPTNVGVSNAGMKTPGAAKTAPFAVRTPARTPARTPGIETSQSSRPMSVFTIPPSTTATTPARLAASRSLTPGAGTRTPGGSMFSQAPARVAVDAGAKTPRRYRALVVSRAPRTPGGASGPLGDDGPAAVLKTLPNATQAAYWLRRAAREEQRGDFESALGFLEQGIKRHARPSEDLAAAKATLEAKMRAKDAAAAETKTRGSDVVVTTAVTPARVDAFPRGSATATPAPPSAAGPSPAQKHCDAAIDKLDAILRSPKPLTLASLGASAKKLAQSPPTPRDTSANANVTPSAAVPPASRGATPSAAHVLRRQLTPNSEFAALETAVAAEAAEAEEQRRVAEEDALAAKEAAAAMLMRQESVKASSLTPGRGVASPRSKPPRSPSLGAKASALSRTASAASASVLGTPPARVAEVRTSDPFPSSSAVSSEMLSPATMLPSLPTPTAEIPSLANACPGPSPGKAAREACEAEGVSPTSAVADAVARATPGSVETRRGRSSRSPAVVAAPSPRSAPLPKTPHGEPRSFATPAALSAVTPIAPNAARLIATPGRRDGTSPLSAFARMMAKVIVDAADEKNARTPARAAAETASAAASAALADTPEK